MLVIICLSFIGFVILAIVGIAVAMHIYTRAHNPEPSIPTKNPNPTHLFHISGTIAPTLEIARISLALRTANGACRITKNWLEVGPQAQIYSYDFPVTLKEGKYEATVALDQFQQGECKWYPVTVSIITKKGTAESFERGWWIHHPDKDLPPSQLPTSTPAGFDMMCKYMAEQPTPFLDCAPQLGYQYMITMDAKQATVNIYEGYWMYDPKYDGIHPSGSKP